MLKIWKRTWEPFGSCLLNSTANLTQFGFGNGLDWLCYLAGNSQMAPTIFFIFSAYLFFLIKKEISHKKHIILVIVGVYCFGSKILINMGFWINDTLRWFIWFWNFFLFCPYSLLLLKYFIYFVRIFSLRVRWIGTDVY